MKQPFVCLIMGAAGAGKSTSSLLLAKKYKKCAVIEADEIRHLIISGRIDPFKKEGYQGLVLSTINSAALAQNFIKNDFNVIIDDFIGAKKRYQIYKRAFKNLRFKTIILLPDLATATKRDSMRTGSAKIGPKKVKLLYDKLTKRTSEEKDWVVIDNSKYDPQQTANKIFLALK